MKRFPGMVRYKVDIWRLNEFLNAIPLTRAALIRFPNPIIRQDEEQCGTAAGYRLQPQKSRQGELPKNKPVDDFEPFDAISTPSLCLPCFSIHWTR